ncbi:MAG: AAA family ATPase, partial [Casimicrobiaceae bacterium]
MRVERLVLKAFGPFSNRMLDFSPQPDFHLIYGPNEAGKSTTLRALRAALFGVPERTGDAHRFPYPQLRIGAVVSDGDGRRVAFMRRKARRNALTVMDAQTGVESAEAFPDANLAALLQGLTEGMFDSLFGFDHDGLVHGGEALLQGQGELGQSLFEAGAGLAQVRQLRAALEQDADRLFRPRASTSLLYKAFGAYEEARRQERDLVLKSGEWQARKEAADAAEQHHAAAIREQERVQQEIRRLERLAAVLPQVASRAHKLALLAPLRTVPRLDADCTALRVAAQTKAAEARRTAADASRRQMEVTAELSGIRLPEAVLREEIGIEAAYHSVNAFRIARDSAASANGRLAAAETTVARLHQSLAPEIAASDLQAVLPGPTLVARVTALAASGSRLTERIEGAQQAVAEREAEQQRVRDQLARFGAEVDARALEGFLEAVADAGDPESRATTLEREAEAGQRRLAREAAELQAPSLEALVNCTVPFPAELARLEADRDAIAEGQRAVAARIQVVERDIASVKLELAGVGSDTGITTALLKTVRAERDALWRRIRLHCLPVADD